MKFKFIFAGLFLVLPILSIGGPIPPQNGGTGISNPSGNTLTLSGTTGTNLQQTISSTSILDANHIVHVDCDTNFGNDSTGNGSELAPYATLSNAEAQITNATQISPYAISINPGSCSESNLVMKPDIFIYGNQATLNINNWTLDSGFGSGSHTLILKDFYLNPISDTLWDFTGLDTHNSLIDISNVDVLQNWNFTVFGTSQEILILDGLCATNPQVNITLQDVYGGLSNSSPYNLSIINSGNYSGSIMTLTNNDILNNTYIQAAGSQSQIVNATGSTLGFFGGGIFTIDGTNTIVALDASSYNQIPNIINGASSPILKSLGEGISESVPVSNFTPTSQTVSGYFSGIDSALGNMLSYPINQALYINATDGRDSFGSTGFIDQSFNSYNFALAVAEGSANSTNRYKIYVIGDQTITGNMDIAPFVDVDCGNTGTITVTGDVDLASSWSTQTGTVGTVSNCNINAAGSFNFNFSNDQNLIVFDHLNPLTTNNFSITSPNGAADGNGIYFDTIISTLNAPFGATNLEQDGLLFLKNSYIGGNINVVSTGTVTPFVNAVSSQIGALTLDSTSSGGGEPFFEGQTTATSELYLNGTNVFWQADSISYPSVINLSNGATVAANMNNITTTDSLAQYSYSSINFTPIPAGTYSATSLTATIAGIDSKLGTIPPSSQSGSFTQTVTNVSNTSSLSSSKSFYSAPNPTSGNVVNVTSQGLITATNTSIVFALSNPIGGAFGSMGNASGVCTLWNNTTPSQSYNVDSDMGWSRVDVLAVTTIGTYTYNCSYQYILP